MSQAFLPASHCPTVIPTEEGFEEEGKVFQQRLFGAQPPIKCDIQMA
jgi:hypothetical protein